MATYDGYTDIPTANPDFSKVYVLRARADFNKHNCAASDGIRVARIPKGTVMLGGFWKNTVAEGSTLTCDIGITNGGTEIAAALSCNSAGAWTTYTTKPKFNSSTLYEFNASVVSSTTGYADLYVQANNAADLAVLDMMFFCVDGQNDRLGG